MNEEKQKIRVLHAKYQRHQSNVNHLQTRIAQQKTATFQNKGK